MTAIWSVSPTQLGSGTSDAMRVEPPIVVEEDRFFWDGVEEGRLLLRQCAQCERIQHPPSPMCPACGSLKWSTKQMSGRGTVHSWIVSRHPTQPDEAPRVAAIIALDEGPRFVGGDRERVPGQPARRDQKPPRGARGAHAARWTGGIRGARGAARARGRRPGIVHATRVTPPPVRRDAPRPADGAAGRRARASRLRSGMGVITFRSWQ